MHSGICLAELLPKADAVCYHLFPDLSASSFTLSPLLLSLLQQHCNNLPLQSAHSPDDESSVDSAGKESSSVTQGDQTTMLALDECASVSWTSWQTIVLELCSSPCGSSSSQWTVPAQPLRNTCDPWNRQLAYDLCYSIRQTAACAESSVAHRISSQTLVADDANNPKRILSEEAVEAILYLDCFTWTDTLFLVDLLFQVGALDRQTCLSKYIFVSRDKPRSGGAGAPLDGRLQNQRQNAGANPGWSTPLFWRTGQVALLNRMRLHGGQLDWFWLQDPDRVLVKSSADVRALRMYFGLSDETHIVGLSFHNPETNLFNFMADLSRKDRCNPTKVALSACAAAAPGSVPTVERFLRDVIKDIARGFLPSSPSQVRHDRQVGVFLKTVQSVVSTSRLLQPPARDKLTEVCTKLQEEYVGSPPRKLPSPRTPRNPLVSPTQQLGMTQPPPPSSSPLQDRLSASCADVLTLAEVQRKPSSSCVGHDPLLSSVSSPTTTTAAKPACSGRRQQQAQSASPEKRVSFVSAAAREGNSSSTLLIRPTRQLPPVPSPKARSSKINSP